LSVKRGARTAKSGRQSAPGRPAAIIDNQQPGERAASSPPPTNLPGPSLWAGRPARGHTQTRSLCKVDKFSGGRIVRVHRGRPASRSSRGSWPWPASASELLFLSVVCAAADPARLVVASLSAARCVRRAGWPAHTSAHSAHTHAQDARRSSAALAAGGDSDGGGDGGELSVVRLRLRGAHHRHGSCVSVILGAVALLY
jgi:hypothetical protein